jgi:predicted nucleotidyltransferase
LRELARLLKISPMTLKRGLDILLEEDLIKRTEEKNNIFYVANQNQVFKHLKISYNLRLIKKKRIRELIKEKIPITTIILYGSYAKGENTKESDIDILVISQKKGDLSAIISQKVKKEVSITILTQSEWEKQEKTNKAYYLDIITEGITLEGTLPLL